jgi:hypothetical protein
LNLDRRLSFAGSNNGSLTEVQRMLDFAGAARRALPYRPI